MRACVVVGLIAALACMAVAGEEPKARPSFGAGTFVSAEVAGDVVKWQIDLGGDVGKKTLEMTAAVKLQYVEKEGVKQAQSIRPAASERGFRELEGAVVAKGTVTGAKLDGEKVLVSIKPAEGEKALEVVLPAKVGVAYREQDGKLTLFSIGIPRAPRPPKAEK